MLWLLASGRSVLRLCEPVHAPTSSVLARLFPLQLHVLPAGFRLELGNGDGAGNAQVPRRVWKGLRNQRGCLAQARLCRRAGFGPPPPALRHLALRPASVRRTGQGWNTRPELPSPQPGRFRSAPGWGEGQPNGSPGCGSRVPLTHLQKAAPIFC